jgi:ABC-type multidrug transport system fused ATPase/permease subunit
VATPETITPAATQGTIAPKPTMTSVVWPLMRQHRGWLIAGLLLGGFHGAAITFQNIAPKYLIDDILLPSDVGVGASAAAPMAPGAAADAASHAPAQSGISVATAWRRTLNLCVIYVVATILLRMVVWHVGYRIFTRIRERVVLALRAQFFRHVNHLCLRFHGKHSSGELFSYLFGSPLNQVMQFYQHSSMHGPGALITLITTLAIAAHWDLVLTGILAITLLTSALMMKYSRNRVKVIIEAYQKAEGDLSGQVADLLRGNRAVKLYVMENHAATTFEAEALKIGQKSYERDIKSHLEWMKQEGLFYVSFSVLMAACTWRYLGHHVSAGSVTAFLTSFIALQAPVNFLYTAMTLGGGAQAGIERIGTVLAQASSTPDPVGEEAPVPPAGDLSFHQVSFAYEDQPTLDRVSLHIPYGQRIAFVGPSGAGKTTISQLMLRLYDPQQGHLALAGTDLRRLRGSELRKRFGVVPQDPFIFRTTVRDNLRVAKPTATDDEIRRACEAANAWEFIETLPLGLGTRVGEGGSSLSGGQRQRLAIARVLLANPPFFIFDEATSALDTLSEDLIQKALERNLAGRTAIFIAHRLATVKHVDRIIVMDRGRIVQDGPYDQLVSQPGLFRELVEGQRLRV